MKLKWYKDSASFCSDLEKTGWFACFKPPVAERIKSEILSTKVDPRNYFTIPFARLAFYTDLEDGAGVSYRQWIDDLKEANRGVMDIDVLEEVPLRGRDTVTLTIRVARRVFKTELIAPGKWMDPKIVDFLRDSIEQATGEFTLISLSGVGQDPLLAIMKKVVIERCKDEGVFPFFVGAEKDLEEISSQCSYD